LELLGLKVETPIILQVDKKGVMDLANNWSVGGCTRHIMVRTNFLRELKEQGLLQVKWIPTAENSANMFTKNLQGPLFEKHASVYVSDMLSTDSQREGVLAGRVLSHGQLVIESHVEHGLGLEQGSGPVLSTGMGGKPKEAHESMRNNEEGQDLNWKSMEGHESEKKPKEGYG
jgi:hypothetical protein